MAVYVTSMAMVPPAKRTESAADMVTDLHYLLPELKEVNRLYFGMMTCFGDFSPARDRLEKPATEMNTGTSTGASAVIRAAIELKKGESAGIIAVQKMTNYTSKEAGRLMADEMLTREDRAGNLTMLDFGARAGDLYLRENGAPREALARIVAKNYSTAALNPRAHIRKELKPEAYLDKLDAGNGVVASYNGFRLLMDDCAPVSDGAAALVLSTEKTGAKAELLGFGYANDTRSIYQRSKEDLLNLRATFFAGMAAYTMAGVSAGDVEIASLHGAFSPLELISMETLGLAAPGQAYREVLEGQTQPRGRLPVNASGGVLKQGHPAAASGAIQLIELIHQLRGEGHYGELLGKTFEMGLLESIGGAANHNAVLIVRPV